MMLGLLDVYSYQSYTTLTLFNCSYIRDPFEGPDGKQVIDSFYSYLAHLAVRFAHLSWIEMLFCMVAVGNTSLDELSHSPEKQVFFWWVQPEKQV